MILMELELEPLILLSVFNLVLIVETWLPPEGKHFSLPHTVSDFSLLPKIMLGIISASCGAVLGSLNSAFP